LDGFIRFHDGEPFVEDAPEAHKENEGVLFLPSFPSLPFVQFAWHSVPDQP